MVKIIDFFKLIKLISISLIFYSCISGKQTIVKEYTNFNYSEKQIDKQKIKTSGLKQFDTFSYNVVFDNSNIKDTLITSYFDLNGKKFEPPIFFRNHNQLKFSYSLMPHYSDENNIVAKRFNFDDKYFLLIRGENPFCNGNNCKSYYLHLLAIKQNSIFSNQVYFFNYDEVNFGHLKITFINNILILSERKKILDTIKM